MSELRRIEDLINQIHVCNCLELMSKMPDNCIDLIITSPPYNNWRNRRTQARKAQLWSRINIVYDSFSDKMTDDEYMSWQIKVINEMVRVLRPTGTICYNHKDRIFNFEVLSPLSWILQTSAKYRQRVTWDRCGMLSMNPVRFYRCEEDIYILGKECKGFVWNAEAAKYMSVWRIPPQQKFKGHPAPFPEELVGRCIEAFSRTGDIVFDPFNGSGTVTKMAKVMGRVWIGCDVSSKYCSIASKRVMENLSPPKKGDIVGQAELNFE